MSRRTPAPSPVSGSLHKSSSEPIDIRQPLHLTRAHPQSPRTPPLNTAPSHSLSDFSNFLTSQQLQEDRQQVFKERFSAQMVASHRSPHDPPRQGLASPPTRPLSRVQVGFGPHVLRLRDPDNTPISTDSSGEEEGVHPGAPHIQLVGASPQSCAMSDASSQTDFSSLNKHKPKGEPNLYSMTPVELLNLPENTYFRSSLSDKMSDYEDIWRSSYYDTDSVRNGSVKGAGAYDAGSSMTARSDFSKFFAVTGNRESSRAAGVEVVISSLDDEPNILAVQPPPPVLVKSERTHIDNKLLLHPVDRLSRLKSSSDSSLATVSSPVYAEPADAVVFRERQIRASRGKVRRRSAPSVSSQALPPELAQQHCQPRRKQPAGAEPSRLATILSPDAVDRPENADPPGKFDFPTRKVGSLESRQRSGGGMSRSQSMRTPQEVARLAKKKPGWQERFNRLKLGTKVLTRSGSPYAATVQSVQPQLDDSLFVAEESSASPSLSRFPVYQQSWLAHALNRGSYFSESSTVQDIISCAMPELMVRPIQTQHLVGQTGKPLSEYDNFNPYAPPSASSHGTIFCKPWEGSMVDTLMRSSKTHLPPAMDLQERVQKWQEANQSFHHHQHREQLQKDPRLQHQQRREQRQQQHQQQQLQSQQSVVRESQTVLSVTTAAAATTVGHCGAADTSLSVGKSGVRGAGDDVKGMVSSKPHPLPQPRPRKSVAPSQPRPQSMYHQPLGHNHAKHQQLVRSFSNPSQPLQPPHHQPSNQPHHQHQQHQHQLQGQHHQQGHLQQQGHHYQQGDHNRQGHQAMTVVSSVTPDSRTGGLSSNCPDVINCHHITVDTGNALSDEEVLVQSVDSTLHHRGQQGRSRFSCILCCCFLCFFVVVVFFVVVFFFPEVCVLCLLPVCSGWVYGICFVGGDVCAVFIF